MSLVNVNGQNVSGAVQSPPKVSHKQATSEIRALEVIDPDSITPLEYRVLVRVATTDDMTDGGIFKPENFHNKEMFAKTKATFISCGDEAFTNGSGDFIQNKPENGDKILLAKYPGSPYRDEDFNLYRFCNDKDVIAILKGDK